MKDEIIETYEKEEEIRPFINKLKKVSFRDLIKREHFYYSIVEKDTDVKFIEKKFIEFDRVRLVQKRKHRNGKISYDFYYELEDGTYIIYSIAFEDKPLLINAFHVNRNFKQFKKRLLKAYKKQFIG
jgi:hypothetical protein